MNNVNLDMLMTKMLSLREWQQCVVLCLPIVMSMTLLYLLLYQPLANRLGQAQQSLLERRQNMMQLQRPLDNSALEQRYKNLIQYYQYLLVRQRIKTRNCNELFVCLNRNNVKLKSYQPDSRHIQLTGALNDLLDFLIQYHWPADMRWQQLTLKPILKQVNRLGSPYQLEITQEADDGKRSL